MPVLVPMVSDSGMTEEVEEVTVTATHCRFQLEMRIKSPIQTAVGQNSSSPNGCKSVHTKEDLFRTFTTGRSAQP